MKSQFKDSFVLHIGSDGNLVSFEYNTEGNDVCGGAESSLDKVNLNHGANH